MYAVKFLSTFTRKANSHLNKSSFGFKKSLLFHERPSSLLKNLRYTRTEAFNPQQISQRSKKIVGGWLLGCAGMCFGAVAIGGITRLTESGLSMTEWHLIKDMKSPSTDEEWKSEFERYKTFPEYKYVHRDITLEEFKNIYFWEYTHRMWGRGVGLFFALPALYFLKKGWISKPMKPRLAIYGTLILCQGLLGWYMVKSGLEEKPDSTDIPRVSQYRLAAHLGSALFLYTLFLHSGLSHILTPHQLNYTKQVARLGKLAHGTMALVFFTALSGAFVAGLDAGLTYNTWPKFADRWIPTDLFALSPTWKNMFENATTVQFNHRFMGELVGTACIILSVMTLLAAVPVRTKAAAAGLGLMACVQFTLGVQTLLKQVPIEWAASHQSGSVVLLTFAVWLAHELKKMPK